MHRSAGSVSDETAAVLRASGGIPPRHERQESTTEHYGLFQPTVVVFHKVCKFSRSSELVLAHTNLGWYEDFAWPIIEILPYNTLKQGYGCWQTGQLQKLVLQQPQVKLAYLRNIRAKTGPSAHLTTQFFERQVPCRRLRGPFK